MSPQKSERPQRGSAQHTGVKSHQDVDKYHLDQESNLLSILIAFPLKTHCHLLAELSSNPVCTSCQCVITESAPHTLTLHIPHSQQLLLLSQSTGLSEMPFVTDFLNQGERWRLCGALQNSND
ncbi:hypothetical protein NQZ68_033604 [Dissostichus eleginoides]|nr:hypothetical protein NQZ68_033604 [Dissostichus eleginoides]